MSGSACSSGQNIGKITQIIGPVLDVEFRRGRVPKIYNALLIDFEKVGSKETQTLTCEVQQLLGDNRIRAVAMSSTEGLKRGTDVVDTGEAISVPVGTQTLGRIFNILGNPVDEGIEINEEDTRFPIHRLAPEFTELDTKPAVFETGIKVVDLLAPYRRGGKIGLFGGAGVGKTVLIMELIVRPVWKNLLHFNKE